MTTCRVNKPWIVSSVVAVVTVAVVTVAVVTVVVVTVVIVAIVVVVVSTFMAICNMVTARRYAS